MKSLILIASLFLLASCEYLDPSKGKAAKKNVSKTYYDNGKLRGSFGVDKDNRRHGLARTYYESGELKTEVTYNHGKKVVAIEYFENGNKYKHFNYNEEGKRDGLRTKYWENGQVQSTLMYKNNEIGIGLEEFNKSGKKITKYPKLNVRHIDRLKTHGEYIVEVYFDKTPGSGKYYVGELEDGFMTNRLVELKKVNGRGRIIYRPLPNSFSMEKIKIIGKCNTYLRNPYVTTTSTNVAIDF